MLLENWFALVATSTHESGVSGYDVFVCCKLLYGSVGMNFILQVGMHRFKWYWTRFKFLRAPQQFVKFTLKSLGHGSYMTMVPCFSDETTKKPMEYIVYSLLEDTSLWCKPRFWSHIMLGLPSRAIPKQFPHNHGEHYLYTLCGIPCYGSWSKTALV